MAMLRPVRNGGRSVVPRHIVMPFHSGGPSSG